MNPRGNVSLTSRNDAVEVCRRTSVLCESCSTAGRLLLSTATLRHRKLHEMTQLRNALMLQLQRCRGTKKFLLVDFSVERHSPVGTTVNVGSGLDLTT